MPEGLVYIEDFLTNSTSLFEKLRTEIVWDTTMTVRKTASFGKPYNYSQMNIRFRNLQQY